MSRKNIPYIIGAAVLLLGLLIYYMSKSSSDKYSWAEHYSSTSKDPYGTYLVRNLLDSYYPGQTVNVIADSLGEQLDSGNYVYVGKDFWLDSLALDQLLRFVEMGNQAFIACPYFPQELIDSLDKQECAGLYGEDSPVLSGDLFHQMDTAVDLNFKHRMLIDPKGYRMKFLKMRQPNEYSWSYFPNDFFCKSQTVFTPLGHFDRKNINFISAAYGKGEFLLYSTPIALTNLHLVEKRGLDYASKVFSHLKNGPIYWDEREGDLDNDNQAGANGLDKDSPLKYILSQPALAWAWYILLGMAVFYLIFRAKRRQRVIPVLEKNTNTSLEFIGTIGRLFFIQNNHRQLAAKKMRLFLIFVRERYRISTKDLNEQFAKSLAVRSDIPEELVTKIIFINHNIERSGSITEELLVDFHRLMERFYRECK